VHRRVKYQFAAATRPEADVPLTAAGAEGEGTFVSIACQRCSAKVSGKGSTRGGALSKHEEQTETVPAVRSSELGGLFERFLADLPRPRLWSELRSTFGEGMDLLKVEEFTDGDQVVVRAEMPGIDPDKDVDISVSDHTLRLRAERHEESKTEENGNYRSEFHYGSFMRTVPLPLGASDSDVKATYKDGMLEVRIPIDREEAQTKKVPIQRT
jgi:HSP20 family protein